MHTLLDLRGNVPSFIHVSDGKPHDVHALDLLLPEAGAFYVMDRGYVDFTRLYMLHQTGAFFVTRAKSNMDARRVYSAPEDRIAGTICDQSIALNGFYAGQNYPEKLRRIRFKDAESGKTLVFLTNNFVLVAIVKKRLGLEASLYTLLQIFSVTLFEKIPIEQAVFCAPFSRSMGQSPTTPAYKRPPEPPSRHPYRSDIARW
jgi:hypothetical protein